MNPEDGGRETWIERLDDWLRDRSLWQVVGVYLAGAWVAFEIAATLTETLALPGWFARGTLVLVLAGLPVVSVAFALRDRAGLRSLRVALLLGAAGLVSLLIAASVIAILPDADSDRAVPRGGYPSPSDDSRPAIAVLPFRDLSPGRDEGYFSDGISEEILQALSRIRDIRVAGRSSAFRYRETQLTSPELGEALGVPFLLAGSVRRDGERVRISAELVSAADGFRLWSDTYDRRLVSVFEIQSEIAQAIADALRIPLGVEAESLTVPTLNVEAHDLYLSARAAMRRRGSGVGEAIELFEASIDLDPDWPPAWAGLAEAHAMHPLYPDSLGESSDSIFWAENLDAAARAARRALDLDPRNASARVALGGVHRDRWQWEQGEAELREALTLDPDNVEAHLQYSELLWGMGRLAEALQETGRAVELDPSPINLDAHGFVLYQNGRTDEAEATLERGLAIDSTGDVHFLRTVLSQLLLMDGRYREALARFREYLPDPELYRDMGEALETGDGSKLPEVSAARGLAETWVRLGEPDRALDVLERQAYVLPFRVVYEIWDPNLTPLHDMQRFREVILPRLNLEGAEPDYDP